MRFEKFRVDGLTPEGELVKTHLLRWRRVRRKNWWGWFHLRDRVAWGLWESDREGLTAAISPDAVHVEVRHGDK